MSGNNTASTTDDVVLSGGVIFVIVFFGTGLFFSVIMSVVCCGEYKEYRSRGKKPTGPVVGGNYPKQQTQPYTAPVTNPGNASASYPRQTGEPNTDIALQNTPSTPRKQLPPLKLDKNKNSNPEDIFSPRTNHPPKTTVAFVDAPLPSISSTVEQPNEDLTPVISIQS